MKKNLLKLSQTSNTQNQNGSEQNSSKKKDIGTFLSNFQSWLDDK